MSNHSTISADDKDCPSHRAFEEIAHYLLQRPLDEDDDEGDVPLPPADQPPALGA